MIIEIFEIRGFSEPDTNMDALILNLNRKRSEVMVKKLDVLNKDMMKSHKDVLKVLKEQSVDILPLVKVDGKLIAREVQAGQGDLSDRAFLIKINKLVLGEERTMLGHHYGVMDEFERLQFHEHGKGPRKIDTRTLKQGIVNQVNYTLK